MTLEEMLKKVEELEKQYLHEFELIDGDKSRSNDEKKTERAELLRDFGDFKLKLQSAEFQFKIAQEDYRFELEKIIHTFKF